MMQFLLHSLIAASTVLADTTGAQPVVALFGYSAFGTEPIFWNSAPRFVLYQDGRLIYRVADSGREAKFEAAQLAPTEVAALLDSLQLEPEFFHLDDSYNNVPNANDLPTYIVWAWHGSGAKSVSLTGVVDSASPWTDSHTFRALTPPIFLNIWRRLEAYEHRAAKPWKPAYFELDLSVFPYARTQVQWPSQWPGIDSPGAYRDRSGRYHIPFEQPQIQEFLTKYGQDALSIGFRIQGEIWVANVRPVFPGDRFWNP